MPRFIARYLNPIDRLTEIIYGILILLTFTLGVQAIESRNPAAELIAQESVRRLFVAAMGCVLAWGMIDGVMYVLLSLAQRSEHQRVRRLVNTAASEDEAVQRLNDETDSEIVAALTDTERDTLFRGLYHYSRSRPMPTISIERGDVLGGLAIFAVSVAATLPVAIPFLLIGEPERAMRVSNLLAISMLFGVGYKWAQYVGATPWKIGAYTAGIGVVIVLIAIPMGG